MSHIEDYFRSKEIDSYEMLKQNRIYMLLRRKCQNEKLTSNLEDFNYYMNKKEQIEQYIQYTHGWERTSTGFEFYNNYRIGKYKSSDRYYKDILFDRCFITRTNEGFKSDGNSISDTFIKNNSELLEALMEIYKIYDMLCQQFESEVNQEIDIMQEYLQFKKDSHHIDYRIFSYQIHTNKFIYMYGELGERLLIKWLNKLSDTKKSIDELLAEFIYDINEANKLFKEIESLKNYKFEDVLLSELMHYSPRGIFLKWKYSNMNKKEIDENQKAKKFA